MKNRFILITLLVFILSPCTSLNGEEMDERAVALFLKGVFLEARNDLVHAYSFYSYADRFARGNGRIQLRLARVTLDLGDLDKARSHAEHLIGIGMYESEARLILAEADYRQGDHEAALVSLLELLKREDISRFDVLKFLSNVYLELERIDEARSALEEARELFSGDFYVHYRLGFIYARLDDLDNAIQSFKRAIEVDAGFPSAHIALASLLRHGDRTEEAKHYYMNALNLEPTNRTAMQELTGMLYENGEFAEGAEILEPLYQEGRLDEEGEIILGKFYYRAGRVDDALGIFRKLLEDEGESPSLLRILSEIEMERGHLRATYTYLKRLIKLDPDNFSNYVGLLLIGYGLAGDPSGPDEAVDIPPSERDLYLAEAVKRVDQGSAEDNFLIGAIYQEIGDDPLAEKFLHRAEKIRPDDRRTLLELAKLYERRGQFDDALARVIRIYENEPEDASVMNFYGYLLAEKGERLDLAEELLKKALEKEPQNGYFLDSLGWIMFKRGDYSGALVVLRDAIGKAGDDPVIWEHLGETYAKLGRSGDALDAYEKSLSIDPDNEAVSRKIEQLKSSLSPAEK